MNNIILRYFTQHLRNVLDNSQRNFFLKNKNKKVPVIEILHAISQEKGCVGHNILQNLSVFKRGGIVEFKEIENMRRALFSKSAHKVIINAIRVAQEFRFPYVGTEHLLFAILESGDKEVFELLGKNKEELKWLVEQLKKIMAKTVDPSAEPHIFVDFTKQANYQTSSAPNEEIQKQEFIQEMIGEMSELLTSLLDKKKKESGTQPPFSQLQANRPSFGVVMSRQEKQEKFLDYFGHDLNKEVLKGKLDPVFGRDKEVDDLICVLMRRTKNNPVLVGEPGVGKTAIVGGLARKIVEKEIPPALVGKRIISLDLGLLVAGTSFRGEFEDRFKRVLEEAESDPNIILFIDELHNLVGAGSAQGSLDAANIIKPALARGALRCIGATTIEEYHKYIEKDGALERRFQSVWVKEPNLQQTKKILKGIRKHYEDFHSVKISDKAVDETVRLANRFISDRYMPDKAIDLLDESAAFVVQDEHRQGTTKKLHKLQTQREKLLRLKEKMVQNNNLEMAASLLKSEKKLLKLIKDLEKKVAKERQFIPVVDERDVAEVVARKLNIPLELIMENSTQRLHDLSQTIKKSLKGQSEVVDTVSSTLKRSLAGIADPDRPSTAFLFVGPTGVGKTYLAKLLATELFLKEDALVRVDMSEFGEKHTVSRLLGSPPGYVGYGESNNFTDKVRKNPYCLILFDEIEKAHPDIYHILLQVLEDGFLTDGNGRKINFKNSIIVFTSNLGNDEFLRRAIGFDHEKDDTIQQLEKIGNKERKGIKSKLNDFLKPEFLNRLSNVLFFNPLGASEIKEIASLEIKKLKKRLLNNKKIRLQIEKKITDFLAEQSLDKREGVRMLRRLIQQKIEEPIAQEIVSGNLNEGASISFVLEDDALRLIINEPSVPAVYQSHETATVCVQEAVSKK